MNHQRVVVEPLPGYKDVQPFVYAGFFPVDKENHENLKRYFLKGNW